MKKLLAFISALVIANITFAQITLSGTNNTVNFDNLSTGLPTGVQGYSGATSTAQGTAWVYNSAPSVWASTSNGTYNMASADGLVSTSDAATQNASTDRALGCRQTGSAGDPGGSFQFSYANTSGFENFSLSFKLQSVDASSPRVVTWQVQYSIGNTTNWVNAPTVAGTLTTGGSAFTNNTITASFGTALNNLSQPVYLRVVTLAASTGSGNRPSTAIDDWSLSYAAVASGMPTISYGTVIEPKEPNLQGRIRLNLTPAAPAGGITINFTITAGASNPATAGADYNVVTTSPISVPAGQDSAIILIDALDDLLSEGPENLVLTVTGATGSYMLPASPLNFAVQDNEAPPFEATYLFNTCTFGGALSDSWSQQSVSGDSVWACTSFGRNGSNGVQLSGFQATPPLQTNEDWFISPTMNLTSNSTPYVQFYSRTKFAGLSLKMFVSTNYTAGAPSTATWTEVPCYFPPLEGDNWLLSNSVNLTNYKTTNTRIAFVYYSNNTAGAARWTLDDIRIRNTNIATLTAQTTLMNFGFLQSGSSSTPRSFTLQPLGLTAALTINAPAGFEIAKGGSTTYASSLNYTLAEAQANQNINVRFAPTAANTNYNGYISSTGGGIANSNLVLVGGNTYTKDATLDVVGWNLEWFGSTASGQGPTDDNLAQANAKTIMDSIRADIYGICEIVDTLRFKNLAQSLNGGYTYEVAKYASNAPDVTSGNYLTSQKLGFIYKTGMFSNLRFRGILKGSTTGNSNWASGRVPFLMEADVTINTVTKPFKFIVIHGKAGDQMSDWQRRKDGARELKDTLDAFNAADKIIMIGDYNDILNGSIYSGSTISSYTDFVVDSTDANSYKSVTLPVELTGVASTVSNPGMIDHTIISDNTQGEYIPGSAELYTTAASLVTNYGNTTTDHYPVLTRFFLGVPTSVINVQPSALGLKLFPNPVAQAATVVFKTPAGSQSQLKVTNLLGGTILTRNVTANGASRQEQIDLKNYPAGMYFVTLIQNNKQSTIQVIKQ
jgi:trimeric autotransporter adhesin